MTHLGLMSRARELLGRRVVGSALVIIPLATAVPVQAATSFVFGSDSISHNIYSGGAFGHANYSLVSGQVINLSGDTNTVNSGTSYLTDESAYGSSSGTTFNGNNTVTATIEYTWNGTFSGGTRLDSTDLFSVDADIAANLVRNEGNGTLTWSLDASVSNSRGHALAGGTLSSADPTPTNDVFIVPFTSGRPATWQVTLDFQWTFPISVDSNGVTDAAYPLDALDAESEIGVAIITPPGSNVATTPLPASVWSGGTLLGILGMGVYFRNTRTRRMA